MNPARFESKPLKIEKSTGQPDSQSGGVPPGLVDFCIFDGVS